MFDQIKNFFYKKENEILANTDTQNVSYLNNSSFIDSESFNDSISLKKYNTSLYVYSLMDKIATVFSSVDFDLYNVKNTKGDLEKLQVHEVLDLLYRPNTYQTKTEFMRIAVMNITLAGETFIKILRDRKGKIIGMLNIRPDLVDVVVKNDGITYVQHIGGKKIEYNNTEMFHIKKPNPINPLRGTGVLSPVINRVTAEEKSMAVQNMTFSNGGRPESILYVDGISDESKAQQIKNKFKNSYSGKNSNNPVSVLSSDFKYQQVSFSSQDMQLIENMKFIRDDIAMAFGVPKSIYSTEDVNLANADSGYKQFVNFTIKPLLVLFEEALNERFIEPFYSEALILKHTELVTEDRKMLLEELRDLTGKVYTINEARARVGLENIVGGDLIGNNTTQIVPTKNIFIGKPFLYEKVKKIEDIQKKVNTILEKKKKELDFFTNDVLKNFYVKNVNTAIDKNVAEMENEASSFFLDQGNRFINQIQNTEKLLLNIFNIKKENKRAKKSAMNVYPKMLLRAGNAGRVPVKMMYQKSGNFTLDQEALTALEVRASFYADSITATTYDKVRKTIEQALNEGKGRNDIAKILRVLFINMSKVRAATIAQTEGTVISNIGLDQSFKQSNVIASKKWLSVNDNKVRPEHQRNNNEIVPKNSSFSNGESYPGEHSINCRCVIAPIIK